MVPKLFPRPKCKTENQSIKLSSVDLEKIKPEAPYSKRCTKIVNN